MKNDSIHIADRRPIWIALSDFYLDTDLQDSDFKHIAKIFYESPYTLAQIMEIDKYEVFPLLRVNLLSVAGVWEGFDEKWLIEELTKKLHRKNSIRKLRISISHRALKWMCAAYWEKVEAAYKEFSL